MRPHAGINITLPGGFIEKGRLVSRYIANSFKFFGEVRRDYEMLANQVAASQASANQGTGVCFVGTGEVMEIPKWCLQPIT